MTNPLPIRSACLALLLLSALNHPGHAATASESDPSAAEQSEGSTAVAGQPAEATEQTNTEDRNWAERMLREKLGPPLKAVQVPVDAWLAELPMWVAVASAIGLYVAALLWVWTLKREFVYRGAADTQPWRDLRLWATAVVLPYIALYIFLGR